MKIVLPKEFDFNQSLHFLQRSPKELLHKVNGDVVYKLISIDSELILFTIKNVGNHLVVDFPVATPGNGVKNQVEQYIIEWLDLDKDLKPFYKLASKDSFLAPLVKKYFGYRIVGQPDLYESLVWAVLGQQINLQFAYTLKYQFVMKYGQQLSFQGNDYFLFPDFQLIASLDSEELLQLQFSRQKAKYTVGISQAFASGDISKEKLLGLTLEAAKEKLIQIKGIGNWTANYALMKTFRYADAFPLEDAGLSNALKIYLQLDRKPTLDEIKKVFERYKGWEAYATLYLWRSL